MIRTLVAAATLLLSACGASPAFAQALTPTIGNCSAGIATNRVATSKDTAALQRGADCYDKAIPLATSERDKRVARIKALAPPPAPPKPSGDVTPPAPVPASDAVKLPAIIASNFDITPLIGISHDYIGGEALRGKPPSSGFPDVVGAFRFTCEPSHNAYDDPIVFPGQFGKSHLHTFFGNTGANAASTYESLRAAGDSTCGNMLNRSAYWIPALLDGRGKVVMPDYVTIYYKRRPETDPVCQVQGKACVALPRGLRYVFGDNMYNPATSSPFYWDCAGQGAVPGHFPNLPRAAKGCPTGARLGALLSSPDCWNGKELDSADHRSHMAFSSYGNWGYQRCPATHPYVVPVFTLGSWYTTDDTLDRSGNEAVDAPTWHLSSDRMAGMAPAVPGTTFHADWFGAWDDSIMAAWTANCIDKLLNCAGGELGDGTVLKANGLAPFAGNRRPAVPARPAA